MAKFFLVYVKLEGVLEVQADSPDDALEQVRTLPIEEIAIESDTEVSYKVFEPKYG